jgi:hypothetical protein
VPEDSVRQIAQLVGKDKRKQFDDEAVVNHHGAITHTYDVDRPPAAVACTPKGYYQLLLSKLDILIS